MATKVAGSLAERNEANRQHNRSVIRKLVFFSILMFTLPIATFYYLHNYRWKDDENKTMWSGFASIGVVNVVILIYIVEAFREDSQGVAPPPAVGKFKQK